MTKTSETRTEIDSIATRLVEVNVVEVVAGGAPWRYEIITTTGYRAVLPACICDRTPHTGANYPRGESSRSVCLGSSSGMHAEHALALAAEVAKTYGSAKRKATLTFPGRRVPKMTAAEWAAARGEISWAEV